jgi:uncharacterized OB-fold protein
MTTDISTQADQIAASRPAPRIAARDLPFWEGCARGELHVQHCGDCDETWFPSQERCPSCQSYASEWMPVATTGTLYTYTIIHGPGTEGRPPGFESVYPYAVGVVEIDGGRGARIGGNIVGIELDQIEIGMRVQAQFVPDERALPLFVPADE